MSGPLVVSDIIATPFSYVSFLSETAILLSLWIPILDSKHSSSIHMKCYAHYASKIATCNQNWLLLLQHPLCFFFNVMHLLFILSILLYQLVHNIGPTLARPLCEVILPLLAGHQRPTVAAAAARAMRHTACGLLGLLDIRCRWNTVCGLLGLMDIRCMWDTCAQRWNVLWNLNLATSLTWCWTLS